MKSVIIKDDKGNLLIHLKKTKQGVDMVKVERLTNLDIKVILQDKSVIRFPAEGE